MNKYALVKNGIVQTTLMANAPSDYPDISSSLVQCSDEVCSNWVLINGTFYTSGTDANPPSGLAALEIKASEYISFGSQLYTKIKEKVWAINTLAISNGNPLTIQQTLTLLATSDTLEKSLKTGSLNTAKYVLTQLSGQLSQYADVCTYATNEINDFMTPPT